jgi:hypothetical protein
LQLCGNKINGAPCLFSLIWFKITVEGLFPIRFYIGVTMTKQVKQVQISEDQLDYVLKNGNVLYYMARDQFALDSGVPKNTLNKIMQGTTQDPSVRTGANCTLTLKKKSPKFATNGEFLNQHRWFNLVVA